jgi:hypothetical protein
LKFNSPNSKSFPPPTHLFVKSKNPSVVRDRMSERALQLQSLGLVQRKPLSPELLATGTSRLPNPNLVEQASLVLNSTASSSSSSSTTPPFSQQPFNSETLSTNPTDLLQQLPSPRVIVSPEVTNSSSSNEPESLQQAKQAARSLNFPLLQPPELSTDLEPLALPPFTPPKPKRSQPTIIHPAFQSLAQDPFGTMRASSPVIVNQDVVKWLTRTYLGTASPNTPKSTSSSEAELKDPNDNSKQSSGASSTEKLKNWARTYDIPEDAQDALFKLLAEKDLSESTTSSTPVPTKSAARRPLSSKRKAQEAKKPESEDPPEQEADDDDYTPVEKK